MSELRHGNLDIALRRSDQLRITGRPAYPPPHVIYNYLLPCRLTRKPQLAKRYIGLDWNACLVLSYRHIYSIAVQLSAWEVSLSLCQYSCQLSKQHPPRVAFGIDTSSYIAPVCPALYLASHINSACDHYATNILRNCTGINVES